jgi:hypothetical protein
MSDFGYKRQYFTGLNLAIGCQLGKLSDTVSLRRKLAKQIC